MKYKLIPIIKSPKNLSKKSLFNSNNNKNTYRRTIKLPLAKMTHSKYFSSSNITNPSNKQINSTDCSVINTFNNINTSTNKFASSFTKRRTLYHSPKNIFNPQKIDNNIISNADNILKQRNNEKIFLYSSQRNSKNEVIKAIKEISLNNYHIDLLKKKRIDIDEKENYINQSLLQSSHKLEKDYENFLNIVDMLKTEQKKDEEKLGKISSVYDNTLKELIKENNLNKRLNNNIVKVIKLISNYKRYGSFLYKIFGMTYPYEEINELDNRLKISEDIREKVIKVYQDIERVDTDIFGNDETLMKRFDAFEEKLIKHLSNKEKLIKENKTIFFEHIKEIFALKQKKRMFRDDLDDAIYKKKKLMELMANIFNLNKNEEYDVNNINNMQYIDENLKACIDYLKEIGNCLSVQDNNNYDNSLNIMNNNPDEYLKDLKVYIDYANEIIKNLEEKEKLVNEYTSKINEIMKNGTNKDKQIIYNLLDKMKRENKFKKIINIKNKREELSNAKKLKEIKRSQKNVIHQKKVFIDVPIKHKQNKTTKIGLKEKDENEFLYYSSEESEENENNKKTVNKFELKFIGK